MTLGGIVSILRSLTNGLAYYAVNNVVPTVPSYTFRHGAYRRLWGIEIGRGSSIHMHVSVTGRRIQIGKDTAIGRRCYLDGRGGLEIGDSVSVSPDVHFITASHDIDDPQFGSVVAPIVVEDYVWIGSRATILPGVTLQYGCVVAAGAVVTHDVEKFDVVAGVPARPTGRRRKPGMSYKATWFPWGD